jgi:hypothetical protein
MSYTHFEEDNRIPRHVPVTMIEDLMEDPSYRPIYNYRDIQQPSRMPILRESFQASDSDALTAELRQIKYIIIGMAALSFLLIIISLLRK